MGQDGIILKSSNGILWNSVDSTVNANLMEITYANDTFVVVGFGGIILTSTDADTWIPRDSKTENILLGITYGNNTFVAVGWNKTIRTSKDAISWNNISEGTWDDIQFESVIYTSKFLLVGSGGNILTSTNGESWTNSNSSTQSYLYGITYGNGIYVAVGELATINNSNGTTAWTTGASNTFYSITFK